LAIESQKTVVVDDMPEAPSVPSDTYDTEAMQKYHADMIAYTSKVAQATSKSTFQEQQQAALNSTKQVEQQQAISAYADNAIKDGVDIEKLIGAEKTLVNEGIDPVLGEFIMSDPHGGKIVEFLHNNPAVRHELLSLSPMNAGIKIASEIKALALSTTPKVSNASDPLPDIHGGGTVEKDDFARENPGTEFI